KRKLIASVVVFLIGAWIAPVAQATEAVSSTAVIVQGTTGAAARAAVAAHHGTVTQDLWIVNGVAADVPAGEVAALSAEPGVVHVSDDVGVTVRTPAPRRSTPPPPST